MAENNNAAIDDLNGENQSTLHAIDDKFFWDIYNRPANVAGFLKDFLPSNIYQSLDLDVLTVDKKSYLSEAYREHFSDLVVQTRFKGNPRQPAFVYFLLEHKSYSPVRPAFQLLRYMVEQWYDLEKQGLLGNTLPPIFPIIVYHGETRWTHGEYFHDIVNLPHDDMKPYIPNFKYFLSEAATEDENRFQTSVVIKCWFIVVKYVTSPAMREKLFEVVKLLHDSLDSDEALKYVEIFLKYLANQPASLTKTDAVEAVETFFKDRGADMVRGWAKECVEQGRDEGRDEGMLLSAKEMVLDALNVKFNTNIPADIHKQITALNNWRLLKKLHISVIQSSDLDSFRRSMRELAVEA